MPGDSLSSVHAASGVLVHGSELDGKGACLIPHSGHSMCRKGVDQHHLCECAFIPYLLVVFTSFHATRRNQVYPAVSYCSVLYMTEQIIFISSMILMGGRDSCVRGGSCHRGCLYSGMPLER